MMQDASSYTSAEPSFHAESPLDHDLLFEALGAVPGHDLLSNLSHELRTPLTPVLASLSQLELRGDLPGDVRAEIHTLRRNVELESRLIDDLLDLTRLWRGHVHLKREAIDPHRILHHALDLCREEIAAKGIELDLQFAAESTVIRADAARLNQVFWHLFRNACKFTPRGGRITLRSELAGRRHLRIHVIDTGIGIAPQMLPRVFEAFGSQPTSRRFGGLGIGLAVSRALVELHHGTIHVHSAGCGRGSTFTVELPLAEMPAVSVANLEAPPGAGASGIRILLVEDHEDTLRILARLLRASGHQVATASTVSAALDLASQQDFDLLLSDLGLPDGSGLDIMQSLRSRPGFRGIALSGFGMEEDLRRSREAGFEQHLVKPISMQTLETAIRAVSH